jgi:hypothetical protein
MGPDLGGLTEGPLKGRPNCSHPRTAGAFPRRDSDSNCLCPPLRPVVIHGYALHVVQQRQ